MSIPICSKCKKRPASVFITRLENGRNVQEGVCIFCAKEMGINPINGMLKQMGLNDESIENMSRELEDAIEEMSETLPEAGGADDGGAPSIDFGKFFSGLGLMPTDRGGKSTRENGKNDGSAPKKRGERLLLHQQLQPFHPQGHRQRLPFGRCRACRHRGHASLRPLLSDL